MVIVSRISHKSLASVLITIGCLTLASAPAFSHNGHQLPLDNTEGIYKVYKDRHPKPHKSLQKISEDLNNIPLVKEKTKERIHAVLTHYEAKIPEIEQMMQSMDRVMTLKTKTAFNRMARDVIFPIEKKSAYLTNTIFADVGAVGEELTATQMHLSNSFQGLQGIATGAKSSKGGKLDPIYKLVLQGYFPEETTKTVEKPNKFKQFFSNLIK